jgi:hypothetical protein
MINHDELAELKEGLDQSVRDLSDELEECIAHHSSCTSHIADRLRAAQSARCKLAIQEARCEQEVSPAYHQA